MLWNNTAVHKGGGIHAVSSFIKADSDHNDIICLCMTAPDIVYSGSKLVLIIRLKEEVDYL